MVYIKDGEECFTREELDIRINKYIEETADELIIELRERRKSGKIKTNEKVLCMN